MNDLVTSQLTDVFRIGLIIGLYATALRTEATVGLAVPLVAGLVFVAAIIPLTVATSTPFWPAFAAGLVANAILLAVIAGIWALITRFRR